MSGCEPDLASRVPAWSACPFARLAAASPSEGGLSAESAKLADIHWVFVYGPVRVIRVIRGCLKVFSPKLLSQLGEYDQSPRGFPTQKSGTLPDAQCLYNRPPTTRMRANSFPQFKAKMGADGTSKNKKPRT